jgi:hypothetical protein
MSGGWCALILVLLVLLFFNVEELPAAVLLLRHLLHLGESCGPLQVACLAVGRVQMLVQWPPWNCCNKLDHHLLHFLEGMEPFDLAIVSGQKDDASAFEWM